MQFGKLIEGLQILAKYEDKGMDAFIGGAEHDVIYGAAADIDPEEEPIRDEYDEPVVVDKRLKVEDRKRLIELGWFVDSETEYWATFV